MIDVPVRFTADEVADTARRGDPVLAEAAAARAAGSEGQVAQYLAGVPDLLTQYDGLGGDPYGQAVITAAMDAARLGHASPCPAQMLHDAAVGYLTDQQRTAGISGWWDAAVAYGAQELKGAVRALEPVPPAHGTGVAGYRIADYLDQHGRRTRQGRLGPASLWDAFVASTASPGDLGRLGQAAHDRGLYRHAALLWTKAVTAGASYAAYRLVTLLQQLDPDSARHAARWAADHASAGNPSDVARLLEAVRAAGPARRSPPWPAGPPATPTPTTRWASLTC